MTPAFAQLMPTSLDALSNLDRVLISVVGLLLLVCGGLALRLQQTDAIADSDEEAELTLRQLHQMQEELEQVFLQKQTLEKELNSAQQAISPEKTRQTATAEADLKEAREEAELTLLQLHQVQEELEHYFLLSREQSSMLDAHAEQQKRVQRLLNVAFQTRSASELSGVS